jgi:excisionase family DNA binding protein
MDTLKLYTLTELEGILGLCHRTLLSYVKEKKIRAAKVGNKWKVSEADLKAYLDGVANIQPGGGVNE